ALERYTLDRQRQQAATHLDPIPETRAGERLLVVTGARIRHDGVEKQATGDNGEPQTIHTEPSLIVVDSDTKSIAPLSRSDRLARYIRSPVYFAPQPVDVPLTILPPCMTAARILSPTTAKSAPIGPRTPSAT